MAAGDAGCWAAAVVCTLGNGKRLLATADGMLAGKSCGSIAMSIAGLEA